MANIDKLKNLCEKIGKNNKATYAVVAIAAVKGIFRPLFTMMDKTEKPETKKYTALREGVTEIVAIPVYLACGSLAAKLTKLVIAKDTPEHLFKRAENNFRLAGVCIAAVFVIPMLCSLAIKPIVDKVIGKNKNAPLQPSPPNSPQTFKALSSINKYPEFRAYPSRPNYGMKVGGL